MNKSVSDLADYPAMKRLAAALWQQGDAYHGAAVMIGAGFSRSGASTGDIHMIPLLSGENYSKINCLGSCGAGIL